MKLSVNGRAYDVSLPPHWTLLDVLREHLELTGTKMACDRGECGACTVLLDGEPAYSCLTLAAACKETEITTVEGAGGADGSLHAIQRAFVDHDALQCGFCTPGQIMAALALLRRDPDPSEATVLRWMSGNLCRCGAYPKIVRAVLAAAQEMKAGDGS